MRFVRVLLIIGVSFLLGYSLGVTKITLAWENYTPQIAIAGKEPPNGESTLDLSQMWTVVAKLQNQYYDKTKIDGAKMADGAIVGLVGSLGDPYTTYLPPQRNTEFKEQLAGAFEGIGAELGMEENQIIVVAPLEGSPAQAAGIRAGDAIVKVGSESTFGWSLNQAVEKIRGPKGSEVLLTVLHKDADELSEIAIKRNTINVKSVFLWVKPISELDQVNKGAFSEAQQSQKIAYIRLSQFGGQTNDEWLSLINELALDIQQDAAIQGLILDLRNNPGGYLTDATFIASEFLQMGATVVIQEDGQKNREVMKVEKQGVLQDVPLVVLINGGSASASEIVAGAMRDHERGVIVGEQSFGKGTIQTAEDLGGGAGLHITVARWLTPNETWVHEEGLTPDVVVEIDKDDPARDAQLEGAIAELLRK